MKKISRQLMKMTIVLLTAFIMMLTVPVKVQAETGYSFDPATETLTINGKGMLMRRSSLYNYRYETKHLVISEGITSIEEECFRGWWGLESVELPRSLHEIEAYAFQATSPLEVRYHGPADRWEGIQIEEGNESLVKKVKFMIGLSLNSIQITKQPLKTEYKAGETFDPEGMIVTAVLDNYYGSLNGIRKVQVDHYIIEDTEPLTAGQRYVSIRYQASCQTRRTSVRIEVKE